MGKKHTFGLTPWGKKFIEAMEALGDQGRLQRGRAYAGRGRVKRLEISEGNARAMVVGNDIYNVSIAFKPFGLKDRVGIEKIVSEDPLALACIGSGQLTCELIERIQRVGIALFPTKWSEMKRSCDCPDCGDPCKHEAAVYYVIAQEIDRDPAALFRLRGLDLAPLYRARGADKTTKAVSVHDTTIPDPIPIAWVDGWKGEVPEIQAGEMPILSSYGNLIPRLLPSGPPLAGFDLKLELTEFYKHAAGQWESALNIFQNKNTLEPENSTAKARVLARSEWRIGFKGGHCIVRRPNGGKIGPFRAAQEILAIGEVEGSSSYIFLRRLSLALRSIVAAGAFHPALRVDNREHLNFLWLPAFFGSDVASAIDWAGSVAETSFIDPLNEIEAKRVRAGMISGGAVLNNSGAGKKGDLTGKIPDRPSLMALLAATFLGEFAKNLRFRPSAAIAASSPLADALFAGVNILGGLPANRGLDRTISARLSVYALARQQTKIALLVKPSKEKREGTGPDYWLSATMIAKGGKALPLYMAAALGPEALAFPALLSSFVPALGRLGSVAKAKLAEEDLGSLVVESAPLLKRLGVSVILPRELCKLARPRPILKARKTDSKSLIRGLDITGLTFDWRIAIDGAEIDIEEFEAMLKSGRSLVRFRQGYVRLDPGEAAALLERLTLKRKPGPIEAVQTVLAGEAEEEGPLADFAAALLGRGKSNVALRTLPTGLMAELRHYQERGWRWLMSTFELGFGCLLADDMGLGKTIQSISAILSLKEEGKLDQGALIIAPAGLLTNWERELSNFAPELSHHVHYGAKRKSSVSGIDGANIVLSSYGTVVRDEDIFQNRDWSLVVIDEAHLIKNPSSCRAKAIKNITAQRRIALSGTPVENNLAELWSIMDFVIPGYLGSLCRFTKEYRIPIELARNREAAERLRRITAPFILRRLKTDKEIIPDLPDKVVINEYAAMTIEQVALYEATATAALAHIKAAEGIERRGLVMSLITSLKQISNHPRNWDKESNPDLERSGKARLLLDLLAAAFEAGERVLVFSQYVEMLGILDKEIEKNLGLKPFMLHGGMPKAKRDQAVDAFQRERGAGVFLISLRAGGIGLNLTAASRVFHYDLWFNPAVENQATDRAFRIGQDKKVFVHRLISRGSLEERIDKLLNSKRSLAEISLSVGETWLSELNNAELHDLVDLRS